MVSPKKAEDQKYADSMDHMINTKIANGIKKGMNMFITKFDTIIEQKIDQLLDKRQPILENNVTNMLLDIINDKLSTE